MPHFGTGTTGPDQALLYDWSTGPGFVPNLLWLASAGEQPTLVQHLLNPATRPGPALGMEQQDPDHGWTPLMMLLMQPPYHYGRRVVRSTLKDEERLDDLQRAAMALLDAGADPYRVNHAGQCAVAYALQQEAGPWLDHFAGHASFDLDKAMAVDMGPDSQWDQQGGPKDGRGPDLLSFALMHARPGVRALLDAGWPANRPNGHGIPPLHMARCAQDVVLLLAHGADPLATDPAGETAVAHCTRWVDDSDERNRMIQQVQEAQRRVVRQDPEQSQRWRRGEFPTLFGAIGTATKDTFLKLYRTVVVQSQGDLTANTPGPRGVTLLEEAWRQDKSAIAAFLLDQGADPLAPGSHGLPVWMGLLANGPAKPDNKKEVERRAAAWAQVQAWPGFDLNRRLPDGRSLLLGTIMGFEGLAPAYPHTMVRELDGKLPKALWWAVHQLLNAGADPHVYDEVDAFPMMAGEAGSVARDLRWPVALAVQVIPPHGPQDIPDHRCMGITSQHEVQALLIRALNRARGARQFPPTIPVPIASAWFATLVGAYVQGPNDSTLQSYPMAMKPLEPFAEMPTWHPLAQNGPWQERVIRNGGPFAMVLERHALQNVAQGVAPAAPALPRRRL